MRHPESPRTSGSTFPPLPAPSTDKSSANNAFHSTFPTPHPNTESQAALREAEEFLASGTSGQYKSAEDVFKALDI